MSTLRERFKQPGFYLLIVALCFVMLVADALRPAERQISAAAYVRLVQVYQRHASPVVSNIVRCRYSPTCSEYSVEAVRKFGFIRGLRLTTSRLWRCRSSVPLASSDPVR
jgi:uncharacterized protein